MGASFWSCWVDDEADVFVAFESARELAANHRGQSRKKVLARAGEDGTHSILDMDRVIDRPAPADRDIATLLQRLGAVFRMTEQELIACFGSATPDRPSKDALVKASFELGTFIERGTGRFAVFFADGQLNGIWFAGVSGD